MLSKVPHPILVRSNRPSSTHREIVQRLTANTSADSPTGISSLFTATSGLNKCPIGHVSWRPARATT